MERRFPLVEIDAAVADRLIAPLGEGRVRSMELLSGGHINTNYALVLESGRRVVLRIHAHGEAIYRTEIELLGALSGSVPVPRVLLARFSPAHFPYPHAVLEWIDGAPLDGVLNDRPESAEAIGASVAATLLAIRAHTMEPSLRPPLGEYIRRCLFEGSAATHLGAETAARLWAFVRKEAPLFEAMERDSGLVHGDFQGDNILVRDTADGVRVAGVLDWEWAHRGSTWCDLGSLLRYRGPSSEAFQRGLEEGFRLAGSPLGLEWRKAAAVADLAAHCEKLSQPKDRGEVTRRSIAVIERCLEEYAR